MRWAFGKNCVYLEDSEYDLLGDILTSTHEALRTGAVTMNASEMVDFNALCEAAGLSLHPVTEFNLPPLKRSRARPWGGMT
jgi:hypothetical protein